MIQDKVLLGARDHRSRDAVKTCRRTSEALSFPLYFPVNCLAAVRVEWNGYHLAQQRERMPNTLAVYRTSLSNQITYRPL